MKDINRIKCLIQCNAREKIIHHDLMRDSSRVQNLWVSSDFSNKNKTTFPYIKSQIYFIINKDFKIYILIQLHPHIE